MISWAGIVWNGSRNWPRPPSPGWTIKNSSFSIPKKRRDEDARPNSPEANVKLHEIFRLKEHPRICEGRLPVKLWLCAPDGKRLESTLDWPAFKAGAYPRLKPALQKKFPANTWI